MEEGPRGEEKEEEYVLLFGHCANFKGNLRMGGMLGVPSHSLSHTFSHVLVPNFPGTYGLRDFVVFYFSCDVISLACHVPQGFTTPLAPLPVKTAVPAGLPPQQAAKRNCLTRISCVCIPESLAFQDIYSFKKGQCTSI